ncbi:uncharacterized protein PAC_10649 [Phialocephala subalpina]|uniref:Uncharacterized protein n=1 Tax=Phialocephala subalpina TaxID=576137 RepID=A0A1L7X6W2_9HELO|nr:uncharacterized protein PAC_10649 [Phialocephala subalpina]
MYSPPVIFVGTLILSVKSATTQGVVQLFSDSDCTNSTGPPTLLPSGICLGTNDTTAISAISLPTCDKGNPILVISDFEECGTPSISPEVNTGDVGVCLSFLTGSGIGSAAFTCRGQVQVTTSTVSNNPPVATTVESSKVSKPTTATPSSSASSQSPSSQPGNSTSHKHGVGFGDRINLGVGIGVGGAAIIVAIVFGMLQLRHIGDQWRRNNYITGNGAPPDYGHELQAWQLPPAYGH